MAQAKPSRVSSRASRLASPLLITLWVLFGIEAVTGLIIFFARLALGSAPTVSLHWFAGFAFTLVYAVYQVKHWNRVQPVRARLDHILGLLATTSLIVTQVSGYGVGAEWFVRARPPGYVSFPATLAATHNVMSMLSLTFVGAHLGAVLLRDARMRAAKRASQGLR
ncbi:MAG: hypothetical protein ABIU54_12140 [Candidatus Eisenbacteria bacterium]